MQSPSDILPTQVIETDQRYITKLSLLLVEYKPTIVETMSVIIPLIVENSVFYSGAFIDGIIIAQLGLEALAASSFISNIKFTVLSLASTFVALQPILPSLIVENNHSVNKFVYGSVVLSFGFSIFSAPILLAASSLLEQIGEPYPELVRIYFDYYCIGILAVYFEAVINQFLLSTGWAKQMIPLSLFRTSMEIGLTYLFAISLDMKIKGWGLATGIEPWVTVGCVIIIVMFSKSAKEHFKRYNLHNMPKINTELRCAIFDILKLGFPACIQTIVATGGPLVGGVFVGKFCSISDLASYQIGLTVSYWAKMFFDPFVNTLSVLLPRYADDPEFCNKLTAFSIWLCGISSIIFVLITTFLSNQIVDVYIDKNNEDYFKIRNTCRTVIPMMALTAPIYGAKALLTGFLRSEKKTFFPMLSEFIGSLLLSSILSGVAAYTIKNSLELIVGSQILGMFVSTFLIAAYTFPTSTWKCSFFSYKHAPLACTEEMQSDFDNTSNSNPLITSENFF